MSVAATTVGRIVTLRSIDGHDFALDYDAVSRSSTLDNIVSDIDDETLASSPLELPNITGAVLGRIVTFLNRRARESAAIRSAIAVTPHASAANDTDTDAVTATVAAATTTMTTTTTATTTATTSPSASTIVASPGTPPAPSMALQKIADTEFANSVDQNMLLHLLIAVNFLDIPELFSILCDRFCATMRQLPTVEDMRTYFGIENNLSDADVSLIKSQNAWCRDA